MIKEKQQPISCMRDVFERIKTKHRFKKDQELWEHIGISGGFFKEVKAGRKHLSEENALKIASDASLTPEAMLVLVAREKAASDATRAVWDNIMHADGQRRIMDIM